VKIEKGVEPAVRAAFAGAVAGDSDRLDRAIEAITERGDDFTHNSISLALTIAFTALYTTNEGQRPNDEALEETAEILAEDAAGTWASDVTEDDALEFLTALADKRESTLDPADFAVLAFGAGGWLLAASTPEDGEWTDLLDTILEQLEAAG
jgi:predicted nucleic acid-binding protein